MPTGLFTHRLCFKHQVDKQSPECPARIDSIEERLMASGLAGAFRHIESDRQATTADILRAHTSTYLNKIKATVPATAGIVAQLSEDTGLCADSLETALHSAGCVLDAVDAVNKGSFKNAFCLTRPPGHHAKRDGAGGFCIFNNVAIAALYAQTVLDIKRIAIIDFDAHHGDGTEDILQNREGIALFSLFQEDIFPFSGTGTTAPNIHNVALSAGATGDDACEIIRAQWEPVIAALKPEIIFISAGFDAHAQETLAQLDFSEMDYAHITRIIDDIAHALCGGKIVSVLEGGYERRCLARSVIAHVRTLAHL